MDKKYAVIFDMDGVLIDSYQAHFMGFSAVAKKLKLPFNEKMFASVFGRTSKEIFQTLWPESKFSDRKILELDDDKEAAFREVIKEDFPAMPGARVFVRQLHEQGFLLGPLGGSEGPRRIPFARCQPRLPGTDSDKCIV